MGSCQYEWVVMRKFIKYKDVYMVSSAVCVSIRKNRPIKGHYAKKIKN